MQIIHFGLYDGFLELSESDYTFMSKTALETIKKELLSYLDEEQVALEPNLVYSWAVQDLSEIKALRELIENANTLQDIEQIDRVFYEVYKVIGEPDAQL